MHNLHDIRAFVEVARSGSFKRAGEILEQSSSAISKAITRLEAQLDVVLLQRSTRHLRLTDEGRDYLAKCEQALDLLHRAADEVARTRGAPRGVLRVHGPLVWFRENVLPQMPSFMEQYPGIQVRLNLSAARVDPMSDGYDLVLMVGAPAEDSRVVVRKLVATRSLLVASPAYLRGRSPVASLEDLANHRCIRYVTADAMRPVRWHFRVGGRLRQIDVKSALDISDPLALVVAARAGVGLAQVPEINVRDALATGELQRVLPQYECEGPAICMVWPHSRHMSTRLRVFVDWLTGVATKAAN